MEERDGTSPLLGGARDREATGATGEVIPLGMDEAHVPGNGFDGAPLELAGGFVLAGGLAAANTSPVEVSFAKSSAMRPPPLLTSLRCRVLSSFKTNEEMFRSHPF